SMIASSSISRSCAGVILPAAASARARSSRGGRSRLPTWSARKGGRSRDVMVDSFGQGQSGVVLRERGREGLRGGQVAQLGQLQAGGERVLVGPPVQHR